MSTSLDAGTEQKLTDAVERLTSVHKSLKESTKTAHSIRRHIKDFDIDMDALNLLVNLKSGDDNVDKGRVLENLVTYARLTGTPLKASVEREARVEGNDLRGPLRDSAPAPNDERMEYAAERESRGLLKLLSQIFVAMALTFGLFVLIH